MNTQINLTNDSIKSIKSLDLSINRLKGSNKKNSEKINLSNCQTYATMLSTSSIISRKTELASDDIASIKEGLMEAGLNDNQQKKKAEKLSWLHKFLVLKNDAFAGHKDNNVDHIVSVMEQFKITSEAKLMDICNPNKEADRDFAQKIIDSVVGIPAKCGTKYKGGKEMDVILDLKSRLEEAIATRQSFEDQAKKKMSTAKKAGADVKKLNNKVTAIADALAPVSDVAGATKISF